MKINTYSMKTLTRMLGQYCLVLLALAIPAQVISATISGTVTNNKGEALEGAIVTIIDKQLKKKHSVYTNKTGHYQLDYSVGYPVEL